MLQWSHCCPDLERDIGREMMVANRTLEAMGLPAEAADAADAADAAVGAARAARVARVAKVAEDSARTAEASEGRRRMR